jgi:Cu-Zn family superoxide dismutase
MQHVTFVNRAGPDAGQHGNNHMRTGDAMKRTLSIAAIATSAAIVITSAVAATGGSASNARSTLRLADGTDIGTVQFSERQGATQVQVALHVPAEATPVRSFHGFHVHANDDPANGAGCEADPTSASSTWFVSADGHLKQDGQLHGGHDGDMPPLLLDHNGQAEATFTVDGVDVSQLDGRVMIVHAGPDNLGNVPVGTEPNQYTANSTDALDRTNATGNAGDRIACGEITVD